MKKDVILFDLDGTLTDPGDGITNSVAYALARMGCDVASRKELEAYIGPPLAASFRQLAGLGADEAEEAVRCYREYFAERGIFENKLYCGIPALLSGLAADGAILAIASSKPQVFVKRIAEYFGIGDSFAFIGGSELDGRRVAKADVIRYVLDELGVHDYGRVVMVGDRRHDVEGAAVHGILSIGVSYGYGGRTELEQAGAYRVVDTVAELEAVLREGL